MSSKKPLTSKMLEFTQVLIEVCRVFAMEHIGDVEIDLNQVYAYITSDRFMVALWDIETKADMYEYITDDIINGRPIWEFFILSPWTAKMMSLEFESVLARDKQELEAMYLCPSCEYYHVEDNSFGTLVQCNRPTPPTTSNRLFTSSVWDRSPHELRTREEGCIDYKENI